MAKIESAISNTADGVSLSATVTGVLGEIVVKVRAVDDLVTEVSTASREQAQGITQINAAVGLNFSLSRSDERRHYLVMTQLDDHELLAEYARRGTEEAFATLVSRHINLVYSTALRCAAQPHHAEEIVQAVFIILARKAGKLSRRVSVSGWLYQTARLTAANLNKKENRRMRREQEAFMQSSLEETGEEGADQAVWEKIAPLLDGAMGRLGETDREVIVLRFFQNRSAAEIGAELRMTDAAARQRVSRALEKLRRYFGKTGAVLSAAAIASAISANSVQAAPAAVAKAVSAVAVTKGVAAAASTLTLVKAGLNFMTYAKFKMAGLCVALATVSTTAAVISWDLNSKTLARNPPAIILRPTAVTNQTGGVSSGIGNNYRLQMQNVSMRLLLASAFDGEMYREVLPAGLPPGNYDFMYTLPGKNGGWREGLQKQLKRQFKVTAHFETRLTRVRLLTAQALNTNLFQLTSSEEDQQQGNFRKVMFHGALMSSVAQWIEAELKTPVLDCTGVTNRFDVAIQWQPEPGQTESNAIDETLHERYGFRFAETNMPLRVLVVEQPPNG